MSLGTVTIKVKDELKKKMKLVSINWSEYIREAIQRRIELEKRRDAAKKLLDDLRVGKHVAPKGFINKTIREMRETR